MGLLVKTQLRFKSTTLIGERKDHQWSARHHHEEPSDRPWKSDKTWVNREKKPPRQWQKQWPNMVSFQSPGRLSRGLWWGTVDSVGKQATCWKHCTRIVFTHHEVKYTQWDSSLLPLLASLYHKSNKINSPWFAKVQCFPWQHNFFWPVCKLTETVSLPRTEFHLLLSDVGPRLQHVSKYRNKYLLKECYSAECRVRKWTLWAKRNGSNLSQFVTDMPIS